MNHTLTVAEAVGLCRGIQLRARPSPRPWSLAPRSAGSARPRDRPPSPNAPARAFRIAFRYCTCVSSTHPRLERPPIGLTNYRLLATKMSWTIKLSSGNQDYRVSRFWTQGHACFCSSCAVNFHSWLWAASSTNVRCIAYRAAWCRRSP
jgi:hypothetical protein